MKQAILKHEARITQDVAGRKIVITREFDVPVEKVWRAFTQREILDRWWAPNPYKLETRSLDFKPGGVWHFCMISPDGKRYWWRVDYLTIDPQRSITTTGGACDENANLSGALPTMGRFTEFKTTPAGTVVSITVKFENEADLKKMVEGGMLAGSTAVLDHLDELLESDSI